MTKDETIAMLLRNCKAALVALEVYVDRGPALDSLRKAIELAEPRPVDKLMQAYEKAGTANALYVKKHYGSPNG